MFERYTERARRVLFFARYEASQMGSWTIESEHLLLGVLRESKGPTAALFAHANLAAEDVREAVESRLTFRERVSTSVEIPFAEATKRILNFAAEESGRLRHEYIGTDHLLLGILLEEQSTAALVLREKGLRLDAAREEIARLRAQMTLWNPLDDLKHLAEQLGHAERNSREAAELLGKIFETIAALKASTTTVQIRRDVID